MPARCLLLKVSHVEVQANRTACALLVAAAKVLARESGRPFDIELQQEGATRCVGYYTSAFSVGRLPFLFALALHLLLAFLLGQLSIAYDANCALI